MVLVEGFQARVQAFPPDTRPAPLTEGAETGVAEMRRLKVHLRLGLLLQDHLGLETQGTVGDLPSDISRICVTHQIADDGGIEASVPAKTLQYVKIGVRGGRARRGVGAPCHSLLRGGVVPEGFSLPFYLSIAQKTSPQQRIGGV